MYFNCCQYLDHGRKLFKTKLIVGKKCKMRYKRYKTIQIQKQLEVIPKTLGFGTCMAFHLEDIKWFRKWFSSEYFWRYSFSCRKFELFNTLFYIIDDKDEKEFISLINHYLLEWTQTLLKFLKENIHKLSEYYTQPYSNLNQRAPPEVEVTMKNWSYGITLSEWMIEVSSFLICTWNKPKMWKLFRLHKENLSKFQLIKEIHRKSLLPFQKCFSFFFYDTALPKLWLFLPFLGKGFYMWNTCLIVPMEWLDHYWQNSWYNLLVEKLDPNNFKSSILLLSCLSLQGIGINSSCEISAFLLKYSPNLTKLMLMSFVIPPYLKFWKTV